MTDKENLPGPLTLEEAEEWLLKVEETATLERDSGYATRLVLAGLLQRLQQSGAFDSRRLLEDLMEATSDIEQAHYKLASETLISELLEMVSGKKDRYTLH